MRPPLSLSRGEFGVAISSLVCGTPPKQRGCGRNPRFHIAWYQRAGSYLVRVYGTTVDGCVYIVVETRCVVTVSPSPHYQLLRHNQAVKMSDEKHHDMIEPAQSSAESIDLGKVDAESDHEVFKRGEGIEDFRTVSWIHTSVIFLKRKSSTAQLEWKNCELIIVQSFSRRVS
jgi:hypothetical protein